MSKTIEVMKVILPFYVCPNYALNPIGLKLSFDEKPSLMDMMISDEKLS